MQNLSRFHLLFLVLFVCLMSSNSAHGEDGVMAINQTCAVNSGCFPGDAAGFPVSINDPGSYRLTSNLTVPTTGTFGIFVLVDSVAIDLNGFEMVGPVTCTMSGQTVTSCSADNGNHGIAAGSVSNVQVYNGSVRGFPGVGVRTGDRGQVRQILAEGNARRGINLGNSSIVTESIGFGNGQAGIGAGIGSIITRSTARANRLDGIAAGNGSSLIANATSANGDDGIDLANGSIVRSSTAFRNQGDGFEAGTGNHLSDLAAFENEGDGIQAGLGSSVQRSAASSNGTTGAPPTGYGINLTGNINATYRENVVTDNAGGTVTGGRNMLANSCDQTTTCP